MLYLQRVKIVQIPRSTNRGLQCSTELTPAYLNKSIHWMGGVVFPMWQNNIEYETEIIQTKQIFNAPKPKF